MTKLSVEEEPFASLWAYWHEARGDRLLPDSRDIDFTRLASVLPNVSVLEVFSPEEIRYRLVGSDIVARFGGELTGVNLLDVFSENSRGLLSQSLVETVTRPCAGFCQTSIAYQSGRSVTVQILSAPLKTDDKTLGRTLMIQRVLEPGEAITNDIVSIVGAEAFSIQYLDIGNGKSESLDVSF